ncbi:unnamed protein product [Agarophyton chilense]|eukprot:gb/GEZJ01001991.1/.p1 GENE.gb/GEZJ01001991.1/~~gb/GEZJ01001991.1/.p1  ORF type:complete len:206 (+),score=20.99 gb/GEZJ01001991.1/:707-1324(+)
MSAYPHGIPSVPTHFTSAQQRSGNEGKILNPEDVPLRYGRKFQPFPSPHPSLNFGIMQWYWVPGFALDIFFLLNVAIFVFVVASTLTVVLAPSLAGKLGGGFTLAVFVIVCSYLRINLGIIQSLRTAICRCYAKRDVAVNIWEKADSHDFIYCKDVFHSEKSFFYDLAVLRDGCVEIRNGNEERIQSEATSLGIGMQMELNAGIA